MSKVDSSTSSYDPDDRLRAADGIYRLNNETISSDPASVNGSVAYVLDPGGWPRVGVVCSNSGSEYDAQNAGDKAALRVANRGVFTASKSGLVAQVWRARETDGAPYLP